MSDLPLADQIFWFIFCGLVGVIVLALKYQYYNCLLYTSDAADE